VASFSAESSYCLNHNRTSVLLEASLQRHRSLQRYTTRISCFVFWKEVGVGMTQRWRAPNLTASVHLYLRLVGNHEACLDSLIATIY
jgi:hypothetical protein